MTRQQWWLRLWLLSFTCYGIYGSDFQVDYCDVIARPQEFDNKTIVVRATYRYGFEWQELYSLSCRADAKVWLSIPTEMPRTLRRVLNRLPKNQGTVNATLTGVFRGGGASFGDGSYRYQLELKRMENLEVVSKSGAVPTALSAKERLRLSPRHEKP